MGLVPLPIARGSGLVTPAWTHWGTSEHFTLLRLPAHDGGTGLEGSALGRARRGGEFVLDPFDAYRAGLLTNPNMVVAGSIGAGKSTVVKMTVDRALRRGRRCVVVDPKGEYAALARAHGHPPFAVGRDGWCWPPSMSERESLDFVLSLLASAKGAPLGDEELYVVERHWGLARATDPTPVLAQLLTGLAPFLDDPRPSAQRGLALTLRRFVDGDLAGLFAGAGEAYDFTDPLVVLDISRYWSTPNLTVAALSAVAAAQHLARRSEPGYLVLDESWALLSDEAALRWLQGSWKLSRARGISHVLVLHRWSDVAAVGSLGSAQRARAQGLLRECELTWLLRQPPDEARELATALGLSEREALSLPSLPRGAALVRYGAARSLVDVRVDRHDALVVDSDEAMRGEGD